MSGSAAAAVLHATAADALAFVKHASGALAPAAISTQLEAAGVRLTVAQTKAAVDALIFVYRGATACGVSRDEFAGACTTHTDLSPACVGVLADVLHASAKEDEAAAAAAAAGAAESKADGDGDDDDVAAPSSSTGRVLSVGNVVGMDWKLGMTVESSHCTDVSAPFVMLLLKVADSNGRVTSYPMELSLPEFRQLSTTLQETAAVVDSL